MSWLNAVIRAIVKRAAQERDWEVIGSISSFDGILREPTEIRVLDERSVAGIHVQGGTIIGTTNKDPLHGLLRTRMALGDRLTVPMR